MNRQLGNFLKQKREEANLTQSEVAQKLGITKSQFVSNWERGFCNPPLHIIKRLPQLYGISTDEIYKLMLNDIINKKTAELKKIFYGNSD